MKNQQNTSHHNWFDSLVDEYLDAQRREHRPKTLQAWQGALHHLRRFLSAQGRERLQDITTADLEAWRVELSQRNFAPATLEILGRSARQFFTWLEGQQRLFLNPARDFIVPRPERPARSVLTRGQIEKFLSQPDVNTVHGLRDRALLEILYATGMLARELRGLLCQDVNPESAQVRGARGRKTPLTPEAGRWLERYMESARPKLLQHPSPALWLSRDGSPLIESAMRQAFRRHSLAAGLGIITPDAIRRACAVHRWQNGAHPLELQLLLGHKSPQILGQYLRLGVRELFARPQNQEAQP